MSLTDYLTRQSPRSGRLVTERSTLVNEADVIESFSDSIDPFGQVQTVEYTPIIERKPLPSYSDLRDDTQGAGTVSVVNGELQIDGTSGTTSLYTRDYGRYLPGLFSVAGLGVRFADVSTGSYEYGYGNASGNRCGIEIDNGDYYTFVESGGNRYYRKPRSEWLDPLDGTGPSGLTMDTNQHVLRIGLGWYGYLSIRFYILVVDRINGDKTVLIDRSEAPSGVSLEQPDLPIFAEANGGIMYVGGRQFGILGRYKPEFRITGGFNQLSNVGTSFEPVCSFRLKNTTAWKSIATKISGITILATENTDIGIFIGATLTGASWGSVPNINASETALEFDKTATSMSGGYMAFTDNISGGGGNRAGVKGSDVPDIQIPRNDVVTFAVRSISGTALADVQGTLRMREEW